MWALAQEGLDAHERQGLADALAPRSFAPRALLYREGAPCDRLYIIQSGRVRSFYTTGDGREFTNLVSGPGALLGLVSIVLQRPAVISIESLEPVVVQEIPQANLVALMHAMPRLSFNLNRVIATAYMDGIARGRRSVDAAPLRLAKVLCQLAVLESEAPAPGGGEIRGITQQDLAAMVDTTRSWVAQMLGSFEVAGLIRRRRGTIGVPDFEALLQRARSGTTA